MFVFYAGFLPHEGSPIVCVCRLGMRCVHGILCAPSLGRRIIVNLFEQTSTEGDGGCAASVDQDIAGIPHKQGAE